MGFFGEPCPSCERPRPESLAEYYVAIQKRYRDEMVYGTAYWCEECGITFDPKGVVVSEPKDSPISVSVDGEKAVGIESIGYTAPQDEPMNFGASIVEQSYSGSLAFTLDTDDPDDKRLKEMLFGNDEDEE